MTPVVATVEVHRAAAPVLLALHPQAAEVRELLAAEITLPRALALYPLSVEALGVALRNYITADPATWRVGLLTSKLRSALFSMVIMQATGEHHGRMMGVRHALRKQIPASTLTDTSDALVLSGQLLWLALNWERFPEVAADLELMLTTLAQLSEAFPPRS